MKKVPAIIFILMLIFLAGCAEPVSSQIDMKKMEENFKKNDQRSKYNDAARKSIFPNMKEKQEWRYLFEEDPSNNLKYI